ncbi:hypothetical protein D3C85_903920 [compost metagenome]
MVVFAGLPHTDAGFALVLGQEALVEHIHRSVRISGFFLAVVLVKGKEQGDVGRVGPVQQWRHQAVMLPHRP